MPDHSGYVTPSRIAPLSPNAVSWLDLVRSLSAQLVVLGHLDLLDAFTEPPLFLPPLASLAVIMFYILSGFLITRTLWKRYGDPDYDFCHFFIDRFCRIYPAYIAALLFVAAIDFPHRLYYPENYRAFVGAVAEFSYSWPNFFATAFMVFKAPLLGAAVGYQNLLIFGSASQFWSLPLEWWLYLTVGYVALTLKQGMFCLKNYLVLLSFAYIPFFFLFQGNPVTGEGMAVVWLMGGCAFVVYNLCPHGIHTTATRCLVLVATAILSLSCFFRYQIASNPYDTLGAFNLVALFLMSVWLVQQPMGRVLALRPVRLFTRFMASFAYSLYLTHYSLVAFLSNYAMSPWITWAICNGFALAFAYVFEIPHHRWANTLNAWRKNRSR